MPCFPMCECHFLEGGFVASSSQEMRPQEQLLVCRPFGSSPVWHLRLDDVDGVSQADVDTLLCPFHRPKRGQ